MSRIWGDLLQSSGKRFYFALDSVPGIITPQVGAIQLVGQVPIAVQNLTVFRTPATATLNLVGQSLGAPVILTPAPAALSALGLIPVEQRIRVISPALPAPLESPPASFAPTLITVWTTSPGVASLNLNIPPINLTQGGNIGFISPGVAQVILGALPYTLLLGGEIGIAALSVNGLAPTLQLEGTVSPDVGLISFIPQEAVLALPFTWVDDHPAPARTWITDAAA